LLVESRASPPGWTGETPVPPPAGSRKNFAEFAAQNLARWCPRDGIYEVNFARLFVVGQAVGDETAEFFVKRV
jgi:hypothetical protein